MPPAASAVEHFGSLKRAFALVRRVTGPHAWEAVRRQRGEHLLVFLALVRFREQPPLSRPPLGLRRDLLTFFSTYSRAAGQTDEACQRSLVGKLLPNALYFHTSALEGVEPLLRVYEGCGRPYRAGAVSCDFSL